MSLQERREQFRQQRQQQQQQQQQHAHQRMQQRPLPPTPHQQQLQQQQQPRTAFSTLHPTSNGTLAINLVLNPESPSGGEGKFAQFLLIMLEICDFVRMCLEPFFRMLPLLGLLYVLVPYYNQITEEYDEEEEEWNDEGFDYNALNLEK